MKYPERHIEYTHSYTPGQLLESAIEKREKIKEMMYRDHGKEYVDEHNENGHKFGHCGPCHTKWIYGLDERIKLLKELFE